MSPPNLATVLPHHLAMRLWAATQHPNPARREKAIDDEARAIQHEYPKFFKPQPFLRKETP